MTQTTPPSIIVWSIQDAPSGLGLPEEFFLTHGGDEDWVAEVPPQYLDDDGEPYPEWLRSGTPFARCDIALRAHPHKAGWKIVVGGHA